MAHAGSSPVIRTGCCLTRGSLPSIKHLIQERSFLYSGSVESLTRANCNDRLMVIHCNALSGCVAVAQQIQQGENNGSPPVDA